MLPEHCSEQADSVFLTMTRNMCMVCYLSMQGHVEFVDGVPFEHGGQEHVDGVLPEHGQEYVDAVLPEMVKNRWTLCYLNRTRSMWMLSLLSMAQSR